MFVRVNSPCILDAEENATSKLTEDAIDRIKKAIEAFTAIKRKLVHGDIKIILLNIILQQSDAFLDLLQIGNKKRRAKTQLESGNHWNLIKYLLMEIESLCSYYVCAIRCLQIACVSTHTTRTGQK